ncbi:MAG: Asp-tRNA(Asn)/Glu-tRNA(Gln) amidotransferase subunit GatC [Alphaproteobacteria bacterium]|nr:MAG: Asp-tRNA(Asn)/Glu-tRNA(Gln) amidotransferase subunit GatC [Alphaproteobacteria bacterium]
MSVDKETVARIAHLARINVPEESLESIAGDLNNILAWVDQLSEVNTDDVEPMTSVVHARLRQREDVVNDGGKRDAVLKNAPETEHGFFAVPKVLE